MYRYPTRRTGTAEDVMLVVARAEEARHVRFGRVLPPKPALLRSLLEAPFNLMGLGLWLLAESLPPEWALRGWDQIYATLAGSCRTEFDPRATALEGASALRDAVRSETGLEPALLALISHPPVLGEMSQLNFELVRHASLALRALRGRPCRPRIVVAVDPFALDNVSLLVEGLYAGCMGAYHVGVDRMAVSRGACSARLVGSTSWSRMPWRLFRMLKAGGEAGMVLSGGIPVTTRALYAGREWITEAWRESRLRRDPAEALRRLRAGEGYRAFSAAAGAPGPGRPRPAMEAWLLSELTGVAAGASPEEAPVETGRPDGRLSAAASECLAALDYSGEESRGRQDLLASELSRETPYRARFFRALAARVLSAGRPLLLVPVVHRAEPPYRVEIRPAWAWTRAEGGRVLARGADGRRWEGSPEDFARRFVADNFA